MNNLSIYGITDKGKVREQNEDNFFINLPLSLMLVADGMGGHNSGELASSMAVKLTSEKFIYLLKNKIKPEIINKDYSINTNRLISSFDYANDMIFEKSQKFQDCSGMGTTLTGCFILDNFLSLVHIGDSRAYILRRNELMQLSEDDSFVMDQYRKGNITLEEVKKSSYRNVLTKALGIKRYNEYFVLEKKLEENDIILLATDGLTKMVEDDEIKEILKKEKNIEIASKKLLDTANERGGEDNITIIIAKVNQQKIIDRIKKLF